MGSRLVYDLAVALGDAGFRAVRSDFRGVGRSEGHFDRGRGETDDAAAAWDVLLEETGQVPAVVGYSFGGGVAVALAARRPVRHLVLVATPDEVLHSDLRPADDAARVQADADLIAGTADDLVSRASTERLAAAFHPPARLRWLEGAGHFLEPDHIPAAVKAVLAALAAKV